jgi:hypothetical protein
MRRSGDRRTASNGCVRVLLIGCNVTSLTFQRELLGRSPSLGRAKPGGRVQPVDVVLIHGQFQSKKRSLPIGDVFRLPGAINGSASQVPVVPTSVDMRTVDCHSTYPDGAKLIDDEQSIRGGSWMPRRRVEISGFQQTCPIRHASTFCTHRRTRAICGISTICSDRKGRNGCLAASGVKCRGQNDPASANPQERN